MPSGGKTDSAGAKSSQMIIPYRCGSFKNRFRPRRRSITKLPAERHTAAGVQAFPYEGKVSKAISNGNCFRRMRWDFPCAPRYRQNDTPRQDRFFMTFPVHMRSAKRHKPSPAQNTACLPCVSFESTSFFTSLFFSPDRQVHILKSRRIWMQHRKSTNFVRFCHFVLDIGTMTWYTIHVIRLSSGCVDSFHVKPVVFSGALFRMLFCTSLFFLHIFLQMGCMLCRPPTA